MLCRKTVDVSETPSLCTDWQQLYLYTTDKGPLCFTIKLVLREMGS